MTKVCNYCGCGYRPEKMVLWKGKWWCIPCLDKEGQKIRVRLMPKDRRGPCAEWPNCECPRCSAHQRRIAGSTPGNEGRVLGPCHYCGDPATTRDHKVPVSKGGRRALFNVVLACRPCNQRKGAMGYEEFKALLREEGMRRISRGNS